MTTDLIRPISDAQIAPKAPVSTDLCTRYRDNQRLLNAIIDSCDTGLVRGLVDSVTTVTIVDADPTAGAITHDSQFNNYYLHFLDGAAFAANSRNRFKITATSFGSQSISTVDNLASAGVLAGDEYVVLGHTHDDDPTDPDGAAVDLKNLVNILEDQSVGQDLADAITDPDGNRTDTANKANPLITVDGAQTLVDLGGPVAYSESGQSQSNTQVNAVLASATHTLILPAGTFLVFIDFLTYVKQVGGTAQVNTVEGRIQVNGVPKTHAELPNVNGTGGELRNDTGGTMAVLAQNGHVVSATAGITGTVTGTMTGHAEFNVHSYIKVT